MNYNYVVSVVTIYLSIHMVILCICIYCDMYEHGNVACVTKWMIELFGTIAENQGMSN